MSKTEKKDKNLFNKIGDYYASKDVYPPSAKARYFQIETLMNSIEKSYGKTKFKNIIDIGCGNGANALYLEKYYEKYTGIDHSEKLIDIAQSRYQKNNTKFIATNIKRFKEYSSYDLVIGVGVLHHIIDLEYTLSWLKKNCSDGTVFAFIEPQRGNPIIQLLRRIRKKIDKKYYEDQVFFTKSEIKSVFSNTGFNINKLYYFGYLSVPLSQVILKPKWIFYPVSKLFIKIDRLIQNRFESRLAWNMLIISSI